MGQLALAALWGIISFVIAVIVLSIVIPKLLYLAAIIGILVAVIVYFNRRPKPLV